MKYPLASAILAHWENDVRRFAPEEYLRWLTLLDHLPDDITPEALGNALAPIAARTDKEQALFVALAAKMAQEIAPLQPHTAAPDTSLDSAKKTPPPSFWKKYRWWIAALALALFSLAVWLLWPPSTPPVTSPPTLRTSIRGRTTQPLDSLAPQQTGKVKTAGFQQGTDSLATALGRWIIDPDSARLVFIAGDSTGRDSVRLLIEGEKGTVELYVFGAITPALNETFQGGDAERLVAQSMPFEHDSLALALAFPPKNAASDFLTAWAGWIKAGFSLLFLVLLWVYARWRIRKNKKLVAERDASAQPPYVWNIRIPDLPPPDPGDTFGRTVQALRRRTGDASQRLDLPATIRSTIRRVGMAHFVFQQHTRPPEYLLLIDRHDQRDHRTRLHDHLYQLLRDQEVLAERFFFDGDMRLCHNEQYPQGLGLDELLFRFPNHRLLVMSAGRALFSATTGKPAKWTEQLKAWKDRALLSPLPPDDWGRREHTLAALFHFAPATLPGLQWLLDAFESDDGPGMPTARFDKAAPLAAGAPVLLENGDLLHTLDTHFPDENTRLWIAACALWPELHYDLTLWIGHWIGQERNEPVATMARFNDLLRLPWFSGSNMPDPVRAELVDWLRTAHPGLENRLRTALHQLLERNGPPEGSAAFDDFALRLAFNEWMTTTDSRRKKALEQQIAGLMDHTAPDFIMVRELTGPPGPLDNILPDAWKKRLFKGNIPALGWRQQWRETARLAAWMLLPIALLWAWDPQPPRCDGALETLTVGDSTFTACIAPDAARLLAEEYRVRTAAAQGDTAAAPFFNAGLAPNDPLLPECAANAANACYNAGIDAYTRADSLHRAVPGYRLDTSALKRQACYWFDRAWRTDTTLPWVRAAAQWCSRPDAPLPAPPERGWCRQVAPAAIALSLRNRPLSAAEYRTVTEQRGGVLDRRTALAPLPVGARVTLLDSTDASYRIRYQGRTGYVVKLYRGAPSLLPCEGTPPPPSIPIPVLVPVKGGTFTMGCTAEQGSDCYDDEKPAHEVTLSDFEIGATEVTIEQYLAFCDETKGNYPEWLEPGNEYHIETGTNDHYKKKGMSRENKKHPVTGVSWDNAVAYCQWLSKKTGKNYRLPTEAEWEYAARGGDLSKKYKYAGSNTLNDVAWYTDNSNSTTHPVGLKNANELGLYDMSGNVWEWCGDWYGNYSADAARNPTGAGKGEYRVFRGGSWGDNAQACRVSSRGYNGPTFRFSALGFRLALQ